MKQIHIFSDSDERKVQEAVNKWILENASEITIEQILQTESVHDVWNLTITVVYDV